MEFKLLLTKICHSLQSYVDQMNQVDADLKDTSSLELEKEEYYQRIKMQLEQIAKKEKQIDTYLKFAHKFARQCKISEKSLPLDDLRLRQLYVAIDRNSQDDLYAKELFTEAYGQKLMLKNLKNQLNEKINNVDFQRKYEDYYRENYKRKQDIIKKAEEYMHSMDMKKLLSILCQENSSNMNRVMDDSTICIGFSRFCLPFHKSLDNLYSDVLGQFYDQKSKTLQIPEYMNWNEKLFLIHYEIDKEIELLAGIQNILYVLLQCHFEEIEGIYFIDPLHINYASLGVLADFAKMNQNIIKGNCTSNQDITNLLQSIWDKLLHDNESQKRIILILHDFPKSYSAEAMTIIKKLCMNLSQSRLNMILSVNLGKRRNDPFEIFDYINSQTSKSIDFLSGKFYSSSIGEETKREFQWKKGPDTIEPSFCEKAFYVKPVKITNRYEDYVNLYELPMYCKGNKSNTNLLYGINETGQLQYLDFDKTNFATFICGSSGSGKSTLLHNIITELLIHNHPDDIEIWLVDFKMTEFSRYMNVIPPHMRYIILDESPELIYDIIDRLMEILVKRQNIFKGKWNKLEDVPVEKYMPTIFVIVDEFAKMSQIIADSALEGKEDYRIKIQELLSKGRAFGMRFIFSSQGFTSGTRGLNDFSKKQIQQRIAMKTEKAEIRATLDIHMASERDESLIENLDVYHTLLKKFRDESGNQLIHAKTLYLEDADRQKSFIQFLNEKLEKSEKYDPYDERKYIYKKPLVIDGNRYISFESMKNEIKTYLTNDRDKEYHLDRVYLFSGEPRRIKTLIPITMSKGYCENLLVVYPNYEAVIACSIFMSLYHSLIMQNIKFEIWSHPSSQISNTLNEIIELRSKTISDTKNIFNRLLNLNKEIKFNSCEERVIFILDMDLILNDLIFLDYEKPERETITINESIRYGKREEGEPDIESQIIYKRCDINVRNEPKEKQNIMKENKEPEFSSKSFYDFYINALLQGSKKSIHFISFCSQIDDSSNYKVDLKAYKHKILFRMAKQELSRILNMGNTKDFISLDPHIFRYTNGINAVSYRPYLHDGLSWDGWSTSQRQEDEEYLL